MTTFIPDAPMPAVRAVPYFEDSKEAQIAGRGTRKSVDRLQKEVETGINKLGGALVLFIAGRYDGSPTRYGFQIQFSVNGIAARMDVVALPMRSETALKKEAALAQALYLMRNWLEAEYLSWVYRPTSVPLLPYLVGNQGKTVMETLIESRQVPTIGGMLTPGNGAK